VALKNQMTNEIKTLFELSQINSGQPFYFNQIPELPEPVQRYFDFSLKKRQNINCISTRFSGFFRLTDSQKWFSIKGEDYYTVKNPGFIWFAKIKMSPFFWITVRDCYLQDKGQVLAKAYSLFTFANAEGPEIDQGTLSRWISSAVWFPPALLPNEHLTWEHIDNKSSRLLFSYKGIKINAVISFGRNGEIIKLVTDRYCSETHNFEKWTAYCKSYSDYNGFNIPTEIGAIWNFTTKNLHYARFRLDSIDFDPTL